MTEKSAKSRVGQRLAGGMTTRALLTALLSLGLLVAPATPADAARGPDLSPTRIKVDFSSVVAGQQVYFDSGIENYGIKALESSTSSGLSIARRLELTVATRAYQPIPPS